MFKKVVTVIAEKVATLTTKKVVTVIAEKVATLITKKVVTLYIDDTSLKLLVAEGEQVKKWATLPLEPGLIRDGVVVDGTKVADKIKELLKAQGVGGRKVIVGLSGLHCLFRVLALPRLPEEMLAEGVWWEAKRVLPVPLEELYMSWQIIPAPEEETQVFLAALPRNAVDTVIETLREAGVKPYLMDLAPLALARVANRATAIIVDVRSTEVDIVVMVEGVPQLIRTLSLPSEALSLQDKLPSVKEELERTIKFYNSSHQENPLESGIPIFASGELGEETQACQSLADELNYSVLPLSSPVKCPEGSSLTQCMVNIGLALKGLPLGKRASFSLVNLNVLPEVYRPKPISLTKALVLLSIIVAVGLLVPSVMLVQNAAADKALLQAQVNAANNRLEQKQAEQQLQKEAIAGLETEVAELEITRDAFTGVFRDFGRYQEIVNGDLEETIGTLPSSVDLSSITHASAELTISGVSPSETQILDYAEALRDSARFSQVIISTIVKTEDGMSFTLTLRARE